MGVYNFLKCSECGKELNSTAEQKQTIDKEGMTRIYCHECYGKKNGGNPE